MKLKRSSKSEKKLKDYAPPNDIQTQFKPFDSIQISKPKFDTVQHASRFFVGSRRNPLQERASFIL